MITTVDHNRVRELRLNRPPVNALNPALMEAVRGGLARARADGCRGIVLSGAPGYFSAGLDVPELLRLDRSGVGAAWGSLCELLKDIACSELPVAVALTGHAPAGGAVMAIFADYRVQAEGAFRLGLNEVQVGLPLPELIFRGLRHVVGDRQAERLAVGGLLLDPGQALRCGLVDELAPLADVIPRAVAWTTDLVSRPATAMSATRRLARRPLRDAFESLNRSFVDELVEHWFSPETQAVMKALAARLGKPG